MRKVHASLRTGNFVGYTANTFVETRGNISLCN